MLSICTHRKGEKEIRGQGVGVGVRVRVGQKCWLYLVGTKMYALPGTPL